MNTLAVIFLVVLACHAALLISRFVLGQGFELMIAGSAIIAWGVGAALAIVALA